MGLMTMLEEVLNGQGATATVATPATPKRQQTPPTIAKVAEVAVASRPKPEIENPKYRLVRQEQTEREAARYADRLQLFEGKGIPTHEAQILANELITRDCQLDDRRSCAECQSFYAGRCKRGLYSIGEWTIQTLHRCKGFTDTFSISGASMPNGA